jgi:16S rRNA (uracil1498-N3)-methyltransferase
VNLLLIEPGEIAGGRVELGGRRAAHVAGVLGAAPGDRLRVGVVRGPVGTAEVVRTTPERLTLVVELADAIAPPPPVALILALPRPKVLSRALQLAASMGVRRIDLVNAWRVDKSYFGSARLSPAALRRDLLLGCEQGGHTWVPDLEVHRLLAPFLRDVVPARVADAEAAVIAHPRASLGLEEVVAPGREGRVVCAIGPEGGWIERELDSFAARGFSPVRVGSHIVRVEAAVAVILAELGLLRRLPAAPAGPQASRRESSSETSPI